MSWFVILMSSAAVLEELSDVELFLHKVGEGSVYAFTGISIDSGAVDEKESEMLDGLRDFN